ncbi:MAG TPA: hypothetical protein VMY37_07145 [Thermoguttaceae bacterium]|nr:hypothetical protein [Thermoguttaceae bacterium]
MIRSHRSLVGSSPQAIGDGGPLVWDSMPSGSAHGLDPPALPT